MKLTILAILVVMLFPLGAFAMGEDLFLARLEQCESGGDPQAINWNDAKITGYPSIGLFQFQIPTFLKAGQQYGIFPPELTLKEARLLMHIPSLQRELARLMYRDGVAKFHWKNCWREIMEV